jgi:hypothetical protein
LPQRSLRLILLLLIVLSWSPPGKFVLASYGGTGPTPVLRKGQNLEQISWSSSGALVVQQGDPRLFQKSR